MKTLCILMTVLFCAFYPASAQESSIYCQYCFDVSERVGVVYISNVYSYPARLNKRNNISESYCSAEYLTAKDRRQATIDNFANWVIYAEAVEDECNPHDEKRWAEAAIAWQKRQEAEAAAAKQQKKQATIEYYQSLSPKPNRMPNGWHLATIITNDGTVIENKKFLVQNNRVVERSTPHLPQYDKIWTVQSGPIANGAIKVKDEGTLYDVYFIPYLEDPAKKCVPAVKDERAIWWFEEMDEFWRGVISGENGKAYVQEKALSFDKKDITQANLNDISNITNVVVSLKELKGSLSPIEKLLNCPFNSLKKAKLHLTGPDFKVTLDSPDDLKKYAAWLPSVSIYPDAQWRSFLAGKAGHSYGLFNGDVPVRINLYQVEVQNLDAITAQMGQVTNIRFPADFKVNTDNGIKLLAAFPNVRVIYLTNNDQFYFSGLYKLPRLAKLEQIHACGTPAAHYWKKKMKSRKKQERFQREIKQNQPQMRTVHFCED